ncbi:Protein of unknown function (DUF2931) [Aquimarina sp. MAR_2010_214]|uniref:DUF2931 family protein n=1 Tax=Aquimarina sp. MAR_2010_214 TaxID=1250026 RepID=UPI000C702339|nr:DUF2931 family protein [Aquimarina sp. MAR_2010_214]PKV50751.1 Protein of unknown function (DUF2931) [Aquimarina sp. MAR_2010_214]
MVNDSRIFNMIFLVVTITLGSISVISCQNNDPEKKRKMSSIGMKKHEWRPSASAPKYSPMQIHKGRFIYENGESINIPAGHTLHQGWGKSGPTHVVGDDFKPIPIQLEIVWVSYLEKKFFRGTFDLPAEKLSKLFKEGYIDRLGKKETYSEINVGLAPGGVIVIWLIGNGWTTEIARFQGGETEVGITEFAPSAVMTLEEYMNSVLEDDFDEEIKAKMNLDSIPFGKWDVYRKKHQWKPSIKFKKEGELKEFRITFYNGESVYTIGSNKMLDQFKDYPVPDHIRIEWMDKNSNEFGAKIYFDENETHAVFQKIFEKSKYKPTELIVEIDKYNSNIIIALQNESETIDFKKVRVKVYETSN